MTFGIPTKVLPLTPEGEIKTSNHYKWIAKREARDKHWKTHGTFGGLGFPSRTDVLLGRGRPLHEHSGNVILRGLVDFYREDYAKAQVGEQNTITGKIVDEIKASSGHFLKKDRAGWWWPVSDKEAREKVAHNFRTARSMTNKEKDAKAVLFREQQNRAKRIRVQPATNNGCCGLMTGKTLTFDHP